MRACLSGGLTFLVLPLFFSSRHCEERATKQSMSQLDCFATLAMTTDELMIIPRDADLACDVVIARCKLHAGAGGLLADGRAIELLPGRLVRRIFEAATR